MNISTFQRNLDFIKSLYFREEWKDEDCRDTILEALEEANAKIEKAFGESLHRLDKYKPSIAAVEKVVKKFPSTLSYILDNGRIPIQSAAATNDIAGSDASEYVPILAEEGVKWKVGGEDVRGGLLLVDSSDDEENNTLQMLLNFYNEKIDIDAKRVKVLRELRDLGLLVKKDIQEQELVRCSCVKVSQKRFEYLVNWDPDALIDTRIGHPRIGQWPLIHTIFREESLFLFLKAGFEKHPNIGGLLFVKDDAEVNALDTIFNQFGTEKIMEILHPIFSPQNYYPILHHIFTKAPDHIPTFLNKFPWATQLRDHHGRSLQQAVLAAGPDIMNANNFLFPMLTDDQIREKDPITTLYPFAAMAVGEHADLEKSFYLLRRHPSVLERRSRSTMANTVTWKIRKRSDSV
ncbi:hypothetical protein CTEN210_00548 [Chaetoceros tenuissimus]|uniref:Uncharacterized protein n=1 Tax=Chaetoceros tenuissimus TaxID=426638 RepID=A0AAD3GZ84_9STRA|nr:hypothetical protein CTEN210_00548 [Chaetoceros tenuissimus]